ncbi:MAG: extensin family protein [Sphingomonas sp.]
MAMKRGVVIASGLLLAACGGGGPDRRPPPRQVSSYPKNWTPPTSGETRACEADLDRDRIDYRPLPDQFFSGGCQATGAVQLIDIGVPVTGLKAMRCGLARDFSGWVRNAVAPAARQILGSDLVRVETYGTYACRNVIGTSSASNRLSGHAIANAVDVAGFVLEDGQRVTILGDWQSISPERREFLRVIRQSACRRFGTVLSPDYNTAHRNHLHLEDDHANFCR